MNILKDYKKLKLIFSLSQIDFWQLLHIKHPVLDTYLIRNKLQRNNVHFVLADHWIEIYIQSMCAMLDNMSRPL